MTTIQPYLAPTQLRHLCTLINKLGLCDDEKNNILAGFTNGRTTHRNKLYQAEAVALIAHLNTLLPKQTVPPNAGNKMRKKIFHYAHQMGWNTQLQILENINTWCVKYGYLHKPLNSYTTAELPTLVSQFEKAYKDFLNNI